MLIVFIIFHFVCNRADKLFKMHCVILPSETARLVYGYLVKENLNEIALQFLENSPYLTDCCQVVKNGLQFNTKLMGKELQDLLQEYSTIHNLVNKKINLICKTSLLYKRIKLRCESLSEILEHILFWKYKNLKNAENLVNNEKTDKDSNCFIVNSNNEIKSNFDVDGEKIRNENIMNNSCFESGNDVRILQNSSCSLSENFQSKSGNIPYCKENKDLMERDLHLTDSEMQDMEQEAGQGLGHECLPMQLTEISESFQNNSNENICSQEKAANDKNNENCHFERSSRHKTHLPELCHNSSILSLSIDSEGKKFSANETSNSLPEHIGSENEYQSQIKIIHVEKEDPNCAIHSFSVPKSIGSNEGNYTLENGSVVIVSPEPGNVAMDQERNQIIVIPIDCYKPSSNVKNEEENDDKRNFYNTKGISELEKDEVVLEGNETLSKSNEAVSQLFCDKANKAASVDENIVTESDFLKNRELIFNLEKELTRPKVHNQTQSYQVQNDNFSLPTVATPLVLLSQAVVPTKPRFRSILPKKKKTSRASVVIVQPLVESNKALQNKFPIQETSNRKSKKKKPLIRKVKGNATENSENLSMPPIKDKSVLIENLIEDSVREINDKILPEEAKTSNEEKENLKKNKNQNSATPSFVPLKNSKRLSLSTPRRKSHIRALEFETPPRRKREKRSRTSPKAKFESKIMQRKGVRNTLFKSLISECSLKTPENLTENKEIISRENAKTSEASIQRQYQFSVPIATRSPNAKPSDVWENLTGVGCVIGKMECSNTSPVKKLWDADLRCFITENNAEMMASEKKRLRKPEKMQKDTRKNFKSKPRTCNTKPSKQLVGSPSKISLTAKRNTYSINGNEDGLPGTSLIDDLKIVTPFKDFESLRPTEETPLTKLLRENINTIDIDLSMINTPSFPPTPSIVITPDLEDISVISGANYYSPCKDFSKDKLVKITDYFKIDSEKDNKADTREMHKKVIDDLVTKAKEIIGIGKETQESSTLKRRPSGKILSMVKIQMLTQCDKKLCENIPINEDGNFPGSNISQKTCISNSNGEVAKINLREELEKKRKRALKKIKVVKESLALDRSKNVKRGRKKNKKGFSILNKRFGKLKSEGCKAITKEKSNSCSSENFRKEIEVFHSTPYSKAKLSQTRLVKKFDSKIVNDIRQEFPSFEDDKNKFPELTVRSKKKIHFVEHFLKVNEVSQFLQSFNESNPPELFLKPSFRRFFKVFYKWLKHPHKHELISIKTQDLLKKYLADFEKINTGLNQRSKKLQKNSNVNGLGKRLNTNESLCNLKGTTHLSISSEARGKSIHDNRKKDEDTEDGAVSILPLKKRKSTVQQNTTFPDGMNSKNCGSDNASQTQNFLQDIDVDRFLSQIHGQANR